MPALSPEEEKAYRLLFINRLPATLVSRQLEESGIKMSPGKLRNMKKDIFDTMMQDERKERMCELMLDSVDRIRFEFEDLVNRTKGLLSKFESEGRTFEQLLVLRELKEQIVIALKKLGEFKDGVTRIRADQVNILNTSDFSTAFKKMQQSWFREMQAHIEGKRFVFENPSSELIDDFYRWEAEEMRSARRIPSELNAQQ
jgi:hypothetical protein